jgi:hypothetical protein
MTRLLVPLCVALSACTGTSSSVDGGDEGQDGGAAGDAGVQLVHYDGFQARSTGIAPGVKVLGVGAQETRVYVATEDGLVSLGFVLGEQAWQPETLALASGEKVTSLTRASGTLVVTAASSAGGSLFTREAGGDWVRSTTAPSASLWAFAQKGSTYYLVASTGVFSASSLDGPWTKKNTTTPAFFAKPVSHFVAAPSQQRLFLSGDPSSGFGGLYASDDDGATWRAGFLNGDVLSLAASGAVVLAEVTTDGQQRSDNYGATFHAMTVGDSTGALLFIGDQPWAGTTSGIRTSGDLGLTWSDDPHGLPSGTAVRGLFTSGNIVVADTFTGPFVMTLQ